MEYAPYQTFRFDWRGIDIEVRYCPDWSGSVRAIYGAPIAHLEIESLCRSPLPITRTGYRSYFTAAHRIDEANGPVDFAESWLNREAASAAWKGGNTQRRQMSRL